MVKRYQAEAIRKVLSEHKDRYLSSKEVAEICNKRFGLNVTPGRVRQVKSVDKLNGKLNSSAHEGVPVSKGPDAVELIRLVKNVINICGGPERAKEIIDMIS